MNLFYGFGRYDSNGMALEGNHAEGRITSVDMMEIKRVSLTIR